MRYLMVVILIALLGCDLGKSVEEADLSQSTFDFPWENSTLTFNERIDLILQEMTLEEKISQMRYDSPPIERLGIEGYNWWNEALHGVARSTRATVFPQAIGLAATFDESLMTRVGDAIATESRAIHNEMRRQGKPLSQYMGLTYWSPNVNVFRDPRWGRGQETYGEDPYLAGTLGAAFVKGLQGDDNQYLKVAACAKHFAVHSGPEGERHGFNAQASAKDLAEFYFPSFQKCVEAGVEAVMCAYNRTNNEPCCGSPFLLQQVLREEWGFDGHVVSDCGAIGDFQWGHHYTDSLVQSIVLALNSGVNLNCGQAYRQIGRALEAGLIDEKLLDERLRPLLSTKFKLGLFDPNPPFSDVPIEIVNGFKHRELSLEAARKSIVLLQNKNKVLPLKKDLEFVYMVGPLGGNMLSLVGNYNGLSKSMTTIVEGVTSMVSPTTRVEYRPGVLLNHPNANPIDWYSVQSREADVTICVVGFSNLLEGEEGEAAASSTHGDNPTMQLPASQLDLIRRLANEEKPVVLVVSAGSPVDLSKVKDQVDAIVYSWYPGELGGQALAEILFGDVIPSGKLPMTFPKSVDQLPPFNDYSLKGRTYRYMDKEPLYPFGFGLSYSDLEYTNLKIQQVKEGLEVSLQINNSSRWPVEDVVQLYVRMDHPTFSTPLAELKSFQRVLCLPNDIIDVSFTIKKEELLVFNDQGQPIPFEGQTEVFVGNCSPGNRSRDLGATILYQKI